MADLSFVLRKRPTSDPAVPPAVARCIVGPVARDGPTRHRASVLSQKTRYAIRAMQHLADRHGEGPVQLSEIAARQKIPANFLTVILSELSRHGVVASMRGKDGGYWLAVSPIDITYGDLIRLMRGSLALVPCASRFAHEKCSNCLEEGDCRTRALMLKVRDQTASLLDSIRLSDRIDPLPPFADGDEDLLPSPQG